jgi:large subunit ribosomal protein L23
MAKDRKATESKIHPGERQLVRQPRLSEKAVASNKLNQYVFTVSPDATKLQIRRHLESLYGITIARINTVRMQGKVRRYGRTQGKTSPFKKAIVTLTKDSKKPETLEAA